MMSWLFSFQAGRVRQALMATFAAAALTGCQTRFYRHGLNGVPEYRTMAAEVGLGPDVSVGYEHIRAFLEPILAGVVPDGAQRDPTQRTW